MKIFRTGISDMTQMQPEKIVTLCGGIRPVVIPEQEEKEEEECTEQC